MAVDLIVVTVTRYLMGPADAFYLHPISSTMSEVRENGTVKWFNDAKGYGFIRPENGGKDLFVHFSAIEKEGFRSLAEGDRVEYTVGDGPKGAHAQRVVVLA